MPRGSTEITLAITIDRDLYAKVLRAASEDKLSVSAWMTAAARRVLLIREGLEAVADWEAEHGALSSAELEAARRRCLGKVAHVRRSRRPSC